MRSVGWLWGIVGAVTVLRAVAAARVPLTGDEAYYWEWSRRLALGYVDHPPGVAYAIAAFAWLGKTPFAVRIAFVLCGAVAALAAGGAASRIARDVRAGAVTGAIVALAPMLFVAFGIATPDGPYVMFWAIALYCTVRAFDSRSALWFALLGMALGATLLSRVFGLALVAGIFAFSLAPQRRGLWRDGMWWTLAVCVLSVVPFLAWNAANGWSTFVFAIAQRHAPSVSLARPFVLHAINAIAYSPGLYAGAIAVAVARREPLIAWTALPLTIFLTLLAVHEPVEVYWFFGPFVSLAVSMGVAFVQLPPFRARRWSLAAGIPAALLSALLFAAVLAPAALYSVARAGGLHLHDDGPFEVFTYPPLSKDVRRLASGSGALVMTDGYGFSSELDFYAGIAPVVIGYDPQGAEARRWYDVSARVKRALFVDKTPLYPIPGHPEEGAGRPDFARQLQLACTRVEPGPTLAYTYAGSSGLSIPTRRYFTTWCDGMRAGGLSILQWRHGRRVSRARTAALTAAAE